MQSYFDGTKVGGLYGLGTKGKLNGVNYGPGIVDGTIPLNYLQLYDVDVLYATEHGCEPGGACTEVSVTEGDGTKSLMTAQSIISLAAKQITEVADPNIGRGAAIAPR